VLDPQLERTVRRLLDATDEGGSFGHQVRDPVTGELDLVPAMRSRSDARRAVDAAGGATRPSWPRRVLRGLASTLDD
jgi:hypothetical protein